MGWGRVDDKLHAHRKAEDAKLEAMGLWVLALSHCCDMLTDGFVTMERPRKIAGDKKLGDRLATKLVNAKLWHDADQPCPDGHADCDKYRRPEEGYRFHDWDHYQPNREAVLAEKARKRKNLEDHRDRKRAVSSGAKNQSATALETGCATASQPGRNHGPSPSPSPFPSLVPENQPQPQIPDFPSAAPPGRVKAARVVKPKAEAHPRHAEVVDAYFVAFEAAKGEKPVMGGAEGSAFKRLLGRLDGDADRAIAVIRNAYADTFKASSATIFTIAADPSKYLGAARSGAGRANVQRSPGYQPIEEENRKRFVDERKAIQEKQRAELGLGPDDMVF